MGPSPAGQPASPDAVVSWDAVVRRVGRDGQSLALLYEKYYEAILRHCFYRVFNRHLAEDLTSETFLRVARHAHRFHGSTEAEFRRWLYTIATMAIRSHIRKHKRRKERLVSAAKEGAIPVGDEEYPPPRHEDGSSSLLRQAIARLSPQQQEVVILRYFDGLSSREIAEVLSKRPGAVRVTLSRAVARLRQDLEERTGQ
jgi:RNA polymerase sigma-70 factor (ECF subfamily)